MSILYIRDGSGNFFPLPTVKGDDGVSITHSWEGTVLTVTSASGTSSVDLKGSIGETGFSPTIVVTPIEGGNRLTITDINGSQSVDIMNGDVAEIVIDQTITNNGINAVSGAAVATYVAQEIANVEITTDNTVTETGTNPVTGAAVYTYVSQEIANVEVTTDSTVTQAGTNPVTGAAVYTFVTEQILGGTW